jgi:transcription factor IIIB subunit 2
VFKLGHCFKALHEKVTLSKEGIQPVLPEDLIYRFASKLEFGSKTTDVAETAVRLVQRMSKDWMVMGRRPSGVCGACLILAARMHNFRRTNKEVVYIVKVTTATIQKRLDEFKFTASSDLTIEDFLSNQFLESAHDPPSFYEKTEAFQKQKKTKKRKRQLEVGEDEEGDVQEIVDAGGEAPQRSLSTSLDPELQSLPQVEYLRDAEGFIIPPPPRRRSLPIDPSLLAESDDPAALEALAAEHGDDNSGPGSQGSNPADADLDEDSIIESEISEMINDPHTVEHAKAFATAEQRARMHIMIQNALNPPKDVPMTDEIDDSEFADDLEVKNCILSTAEARVKEQIWLNENKDWVKAQAEKEYKKKLAEMGPPKATRKRVKKPRIGEGQTSAANTPEEAAVDFVKNRAWSKRINYDAIKGLFDGSGSALGSATTSRVTSRAGSTVATSVAGTSRAGSVVGSVAGSVVGSVAGSVVGSVVGSASSAMSSDVGNALLGELDEDLDDNWQDEFNDD